MEFILKRRCPNMGQWVEFRYVVQEDWFKLVSTTCTDQLGHSFGMMCPCWEIARDEIPDIFLVYRTEPSLWPQAACAAREGLLKDEHTKAAAAEIIFRAVAEGFISQETAKEALEKIRITNPQSQGEIFALAAEIGLDLTPFANLFGDRRLQQIAKRENVRAAFGQFTLGELGWTPHPQAVKYVRRFEGDDVIKPLMARYEQIMKRVAHGRLCKEIGWPLPDLNEEERAQRQSYLFFEKVREIFADASTDTCARYVLGDLVFESFTLPNQTEGGVFHIRGGNTLTIAEVKAYINEYAKTLQRVADQI